MIPSVAEDISVETTVTGEKIAMSLDENSLAHLMTVLTNLYSDPEMAVLREYSTNARDSHVEAGITRPIEVTLPSVLNPFLHIKDFGIGLNEADIAEIYSKYGASTKRETNEQTGVLGLGCKSGLTYSPQFSLVGIKEGTRTMVSIARDEDGTGSMTIVESAPTDEPNGVEVIIPVRRYNNLEEKARDLFRFWEPGTVLVNGDEPERIEGTKVSDMMLIAEHLHTDFIVMGGVPYPVSLNTPLAGKYKLVVFADIGDINFTPSREDLQQTKRTKDFIALAQERFVSQVQGAIQRDIEGADSPRAAFYTAIRWRDALPHLKMDMTYKQQEIPLEFVAPDGKKIVVSNRHSDVLSRHSKHTTLAAGTFINGLLVYGYNMTNFTASHKKKLKKFAEDAGINAEHFILSEDRIESVWLDPASMVEWETIRAIKLDNHGRAGGAGRIKGSYDMWEQGQFRNEVPAEEIDGELPLFFFTTHDFKVVGRNATRNGDAVRLITKFFPDCTVVLMGSNRTAKFCRDFPSAKSIQDVLCETYDRIADEIDPKFIKAYKLDGASSYGQPLGNLDASLIDDPELAEAVRLADMTGVDAAIEPLREFNVIRQYVGISDRLERDYENDPLDGYPLLSNCNFRNEVPSHLYLYVNAAYAAAQAEKE